MSVVQSKIVTSYIIWQQKRYQLFFSKKMIGELYLQHLFIDASFTLIIGPNRQVTLSIHNVSVTNITLYCIWFGYALQLAAGAFRLLHPGGDSSCPWVSVHTLGHNFGKDRTFMLYPLFEKVLSNKEYTRLLAWTLYCTLLAGTNELPPQRDGEWQSWLLAIVLTKSNIIPGTNTNINTLQ